MPYLTEFEVLRPRYQATQQELLNWIIQAHLISTPSINQDELKKDFVRIGLGEEKIKTRGFHLKDCTHFNWKEMEIYDFSSDKEGVLLDRRMAFFTKAAQEVFENLYSSKEPSPHLIHTTCTGYVAPSPAQRFISMRQKGKEVMVTHAYHMGCYAAIPSVRMGMGHCLTHKEPTDVIHTEFSSLHMNPSLHNKEQLLVQSLFADGFIKYKVSPSLEKKASFEILAILEEIIPDSIDTMSWVCHPWGFQMSLAREIPLLIRNALVSFRKKLISLAGKTENDLGSLYYAIHPGGPKIIEQIASHLSLAPSQFAHSKKIFEQCGNMSSATLPHIWEKMLRDPEIPNGSHILSLAFGPGLVICGTLLEKKEGE